MAYFLYGRWTWWGLRIAGTAFICSASYLCLLVCNLSRVRSGKRALPIIGMILVLIAATLQLTVTLAEQRFIFDHLMFLRLTNISAIFAGATVHSCSLLLANLRDGFKWFRRLSILVSYGLAILASYYNFLGYENGFELQINQDVLHWIYMLLFLAALLSLIVLLLHVVGKADTDSTGESG